MNIQELKARIGEDLSYTDFETEIAAFNSQERADLLEALKQRRRQFWNKYANFYINIFPKLPGIDKHFEALIEKTKPQPGQVIVDFGCATGRTMERILNVNPEVEKVIGIDYAGDMVKQAERLKEDWEKKGKRYIWPAIYSLSSGFLQKRVQIIRKRLRLINH